MLDQTAQNRCDIWHVHQDVATNQGIELLAGAELCKAGLFESNITQTKCFRPGASDGQSRIRLIDPSYMARFSDEVGCQKRNVADAAADIKHTHTRSDPSFDKEPPSDRLNQFCLSDEPLDLARAVARNILRRMRTHATTSSRSTGIRTDGRAAVRQYQRWAFAVHLVIQPDSFKLDQRHRSLPLQLTWRS
jgi:hypothetical protein